MQRPFEGHTHEQLAQAIVKGDPNYPVTNPAVSMVCMHAISSLLEKDKNQRIGAAGFGTFTDNPFFREIDFEALVRKEIEPVFRPSSEKTNFDATYDLEELLLEEAPLEARTRKQKPRAELRPDATEAEKRADELHRMIETMFEPFNYTTLPEHRNPVTVTQQSAIENPPPKRVVPNNSQEAVQSEQSGSLSRQPTVKGQSIPTPRSQTPHSVSRTRSSTHSPNGSPPLPSAAMSGQYNASTSPPGQDYFPPTSQPPVPPLPGTQQALHKLQSIRYDDTVQNPAPTSHPSNSRSHRPRGSTRSTSMGGGVQVVLNETGSWSDMANQSQGMLQHEESRKPAGMLGFLSRKKGRDRSPKAKERERGVLGKEGARVIVGG